MLKGTGVLLILAGIGCAVGGFVGPDDLQIALIGVGAALFAAGAFNLMLGGFIGKMTEGLPKAPSILDAANTMHLVAEMQKWQNVKNRVRMSGTEGTATVLSAENTGQEFNFAPIYRVELSVKAGLQPAFTSTVTDAIPTFAVDRLKQGASFPAKFDPNDKGAVVVEW